MFNLFVLKIIFPAILIPLVLITIDVEDFLTKHGLGVIYPNVLEEEIEMDTLGMLERCI